MKGKVVATVIVSLVTAGPIVAQSSELEITLKNGTVQERAARDQLIRLTREYDLRPWFYTKRIQIDEKTGIPHSHPVLTLNTESLDDDLMQLSTFLHEQLHWRVDEANDPKAKAALDDFRRLFPDAPGREGGGARDQFSTYLHLIVCDLELQSLAALIGETKARELLRGVTHYTWIYRQVLDDPRIREVNRRHGFIIGDGGADSPPKVRLTFRAQSDSFAAATREYERLWAAEGERMVAALEAGSGLRFVTQVYADTAITVIVFEGVSNSGYRDRPMMMRASYSPDTKKATLLHELGHRLMADMFRRDEEPHAALFLWLYDVWIDLYGQAFADEQVVVEKRRRGPYPAAWDAATSRTREQRRQRWSAIVAERLTGVR